MYEEVKAISIEPKFSVRQVKRGLHETGQGRLIHADMNRAAITLRKEIGKEIGNE